MTCDPAVTTLLDVVTAIDPLKRMTECPLGREAHSGGLCPLHHRIDEVMGILETSLRSMTLQSVIDGAEGPALCLPADFSAPAADGQPAAPPSVSTPSPGLGSS